MVTGDIKAVEVIECLLTKGCKYHVLRDDVVRLLMIIPA